MSLVPAVMALLGDRAWWLPGWLDRRLPNLDIEGASLTEPGPAPSAASLDGDGGPPEERPAPSREPVR
jgi:RND superfamily putative drug exporter